MSKLINELMQEHNEIADLFRTIMKSGVTSNKGLDIVKHSKTKLLEHLKKEDNYLYPPLYKMAKKDVLLRNTLRNFGDELEIVTQSVQIFYSKYSSMRNINKKEFVEDMSALNILLKSRIMKEEVSLYKAYEKLNVD